jgi:asparagine synthase (glutamine-hydrolysing)
VVIVSSSPESFRHHPLFRAEVDPLGLAALLLLHSPSQGETLHAGVNRLRAGHVLLADTGRGIREVVDWSPPQEPVLPDTPFAHHVQLLDQALEEAVARQTAPGIRHAVLLSGGRDSRMLAGYLRDLGHRPLAITVGEVPEPERLHPRSAPTPAEALVRTRGGA